MPSIDALSQLADGHIVKQDGVDFDARRLFELRKRVRFDLYLDEVANMGVNAADCFRSAAGDGHVIVVN